MSSETGQSGSLGKGTFLAPKTQRVAMMNAVRCVCMCSVLHVPMHRIEFFRLQVWDAHTQAWDGRPKALDVHPKATYGDFSLLHVPFYARPPHPAPF